ncbi:hypothetical protein LWI29_013208 [Acer saccharum]|uniref:Aspartic peptidase DDI1-type domain-containing protein n=1 Tax=Acer saccharum TaxID=4024 RepID=A0AA39VN15_ACESA|nr:hypothetical protein LWI29_013208 [Acer saccharum]
MASKVKLDQAFREIYDILSKVNVSLPLLEVIEKMPAYVKFFKELNSKTRKKEFLERIVISKEASAAMETTLPPKMKDPGSFIITISVGETQKEKAMLDLGASINLMPYALFKDLRLEGLKPTTMELILADRSVRHPIGVVEDVLVRVGELIIPADFVILEMETDSTKAREMPILLGRPFMSTAKAIIDVHKGRLSMTVLGIFLYQSDFWPLLENWREKGRIWKNLGICEYVIAGPTSQIFSRRCRDMTLLERSHRSCFLISSRPRCE